MRPPAYWYNPPGRPGLRARLLAPLGMLYARSTARRLATGHDWRAPVPVICIGNLNFCGTGTMPAVLAVVAHLHRMGHEPAILSWGKTGLLRGPVQVAPRHHTSADVGDGPLLAADFAPTWSARDWVEGARAILSADRKGGAPFDCIVMDDGFQNPSLAKDISIVVVDAVRGFGNSRCLPAGPLREPVKRGLTRADLLLSIGPKSAQDRFSELWGEHINLPHLQGELHPLQTGMEWPGSRLLAFSGIGDPGRFFAILRGLGAELVRCESFEDQQPYSQALLARLEREATNLGAQLVTTEKDAVRLPQDFRRKVLTLPVRLHVSDLSPLEYALTRAGLGPG
ncbi:tetraacyldisaccharide 4'-kinase [uncultured Roseovarius sp.]|uniref:tetraacyldisaccharide 4'-kinase n=1 Tax=uncultured Roseovarius sp. TaxID=293344 RepID=UPI002606A85E|nr:tetraacyldisaccharide 4'-kinase [uncultured Roseovarius sp.]